MSEQPEKEVSQNKAISLETVLETLARVENQNNFMNQQLVVLSGQMQGQIDTFQKTSSSLERELQRFQTGAGKHALSTIFFKFVRDLIEHVNQIDDLVNIARSETLTAGETAWIEAIEALQGGLETTLEKWGCKAVTVKLGEDTFDPELHEAVDDGKDIPADAGENVIVRVVRRGWQIGETIIQYPRVIVS